jgi:hypothetical protein
MHPNSIGGGSVPRSVIAQGIKIPPVLFTRNFKKKAWPKKLVFDKTFLKSFLKSLRRSSAWSESEPEVGYAGDDAPATWGKFNASMGWYTVWKRARNGFAIGGQHVCLGSGWRRSILKKTVKMLE